MPNLKHMVMLASLFAVSAEFPAAAAVLGTQKSSERGVTVEATPQNLAGGAKSWDFKVVTATESDRAANPASGQIQAALVSLAT